MKAILIFGELFLNWISLLKLKLISFFIARYLTVSLRGPVLTLRRGALRRVVWNFSSLRSRHKRRWHEFIPDFLVDAFYKRHLLPPLGFLVALINFGKALFPVWVIYILIGNRIFLFFQAHTNMTLGIMMREGNGGRDRGWVKG